MANSTPTTARTTMTMADRIFSFFALFIPLVREFGLLSNARHPAIDG